MLTGTQDDYIAVVDLQCRGDYPTSSYQISLHDTITTSEIESREGGERVAGSYVSIRLNVFRVMALPPKTQDTIFIHRYHVPI